MRAHAIFTSSSRVHQPQYVCLAQKSDLYLYSKFGWENRSFGGTPHHRQFETKFDYFHVINDNAMFNTFYLVGECSCDCDLRDMNLVDRLYLVLFGIKRPIDAPYGNKTHTKSISFHLWTIFAAWKSFESLFGFFFPFPNRIELEKKNIIVADVEEKAAPNSIANRVCIILLCQRKFLHTHKHTITFHSSHSEPLTHFSFFPFAEFVYKNQTATTTNPMRKAPKIVIHWVWNCVANRYILKHIVFGSTINLKADAHRPLDLVPDHRKINTTKATTEKSRR